MTEDQPLGLLFGLLGLLLILSAFFSGTETALMSLNRYRLRHRARSGHRGARLAEALLRRPDRLIGLILLGNNLVNISAASLVTLISLRLGGEIALTAPGRPALKTGQRLAAGIRSEEVVVIRPHKPIGPELQENLFDAVVEDILAFGGTHTLSIRLQAHPVTIEAELPNCALRDLGYAIGDELRVCLRKTSLWLVPEQAPAGRREVSDDQL